MAPNLLCQAVSVNIRAVNRVVDLAINNGSKIDRREFFKRVLFGLQITILSAVSADKAIEYVRDEYDDSWAGDYRGV